MMLRLCTALTVVAVISSSTPASAWDFGKAVIGSVIAGPVGAVVGGGHKEIKEAVQTVAPNNPTCVHYFGNPYYIKLVHAMRHNKEELAHRGITDRNSCRVGRDKVAAAIYAKTSGVGIVPSAMAWDMGRCACDKAF